MGRIEAGAPKGSEEGGCGEVGVVAVHLAARKGGTEGGGTRVGLCSPSSRRPDLQVTPSRVYPRRLSLPTPLGASTPSAD